jgi:hypothetical protein
MKRLLSTFCLLLGASLASFAGLITSTTGTNLTGANAALQDFENTSAFPLASFTTLPTTSLSNGVQLTVSASGPSGSPGTFNTGNTGRVGNTVGSVYGTSTTAGVGSLSGRYLQTWNGASVTSSNSFVRTLTFTFGNSGSSVSEFLIDYFDSNSGSVGSSAHALVVNLSGGTQISTSLSQTNSGVCGSCTGTGRQIGWVADGGATINSFSILMSSNNGDQDASYGGDMLILDNLRTVGTNQNGGQPPVNPPGDIPEPSTYALLGAGLLSIAYARRRK